MSAGKAPPRWTCLTCGRRVPAEVAECHCGMTRQAAEARVAREAQKKAPTLSIAGLLGQLAILAAVFYLGLTWQRPPEGPPAPVGRPLIPSADPVPPSSRDPSPPRLPLATAPAESPSPEMPPTPEEPADPPTPAASDSPSSIRSTPSPKPERSEMDVKREQAERRFEQALARLGSEASRLSANVRRFESICLGGRGEPASCERGLREISASAESLSRGVQEAEEDARHAWVTPGVVRDQRHRYGLDEATLSDFTATVQRFEAQLQGKR